MGAAGVLPVHRAVNPLTACLLCLSDARIAIGRSLISRSEEGSFHLRFARRYHQTILTRCTIFTEGPGSDLRNTSLIAALIAVVLALGFWIWFSPPLWLLVGYVLISAVAVFSVPAMYRAGGYTLADELEWLENREAQEHHDMLQRLSGLRTELSSLNIGAGVRQADVLTEILTDYHKVVETRFVGKKHSPLAYLSTARTVQKHAIQNLNDVVAVGHSLQSISRHGFDEPSASWDEHIENVGSDNERRDRYVTMQREQETRMSGLLSQNQQLFDALTDTAVEVANIDSFSKYERIDTLARLVSLSEIASKTGR